MKRLFICLVLLVVACGDSADSTTATSTTAPDGETTTTTAPGDDSTTSTTPGATTTTAAESLPPLDDVEIDVEVVTQMPTQPVFVLARPGDDRLFIVDQVGRILQLDHDDPDPALASALDLTGQVVYANEQGLLGAVFHPGDPERLFVHYSAASNGSGIVEEYRFPLNADAADPDPVRRLLEVPQPAANHNGGMIDFGPDGMLYIALGDGGGGGDPFQQGQDTSTLLGAILRVDVDTGDPYAIPLDNPFVDGGGAAEVWAYGLRNPWRFSFDGDDLWIADVGQGDWEEINVITVGDGGANFGWPVMEGTHCFSGPPDLCDSNDFIAPILDYTIRGTDRCAVMGGYVYRGNAVPDLRGTYLFADWCSGEIMGLRLTGGEVEQRVLLKINDRVTSFGIDSDGELYVTGFGGVYKVVAGE